MHILLAADTYQHHPRNILGFKKKGAQPYTRLVTTIAVDATTSKTICADRYKCRLKDDPAWHGTDETPQYLCFYRPPVKYGVGIDDLMAELAMADAKEILYHGKAYEGLREACYRLYGESPGSYIGKTFVDIDYFLPHYMQKYSSNDLAMLSAEDCFQSSINVSEHWAYAIAELKELLESHTDYEVISPSDNAATISRKMYRNYNLVMYGIPHEIEYYSAMREEE